MQNSSRTARSLQNAKVALAFYVLNLVLQFFSRKVFLDYLGSEVLGLNTTAQNLLGFLNLAELGIGTAVAYNLYKPLFDGDRQAINDIVSIQGWLYRRIACVVIASAMVLMCFFPLIFAKAEVPLWYTYGSFIALLTNALLGYFVNYRQIVLSADQKEYKVTYCVQGTKLVKAFLQMVAIYLLAYGYVWWMVLELVFAMVTSIVLDRAIKKEYPWLRPAVAAGKVLRKQYPEIITKTKLVFFHLIGGFVLRQSSPLVIYAYASLTLVAIYGNYMLIVTGITALSNAMLNGIGAGIGNLVAEGKKTRIKAVFWEVIVLRMWIASIFCFGMYVLGHPFIALWVGNGYFLPQSAFLVLIIITFIDLTRTYDLFINAYGLFQDIWSPLVEATLNLGLSIFLGYYYGITGILSGVLISLLLVICCWKPYFLYSRGFKESILEYVLHYMKYIGLLATSFYISMVMPRSFLGFSLSESDYTWQIVYGMTITALYAIISLLLLYSTDKSSKKFVHRILNKRRH